jgi:hypothetical protein
MPLASRLEIAEERITTHTTFPLVHLQHVRTSIPQTQVQKLYKQSKTYNRKHRNRPMQAI